MTLRNESVYEWDQTDQISVVNVWVKFPSLKLYKKLGVFKIGPFQPSFLHGSLIVPH